MAALRVAPVEIAWHCGLPIFARESFLEAVGDEYGWLGGIDESGRLRCVLPYTIIRKAIFRLVRFRVATISLGEQLDIAEERSFLNGVITYFRSAGADTIIPATTNTIFRAYPDGASAAPYGSYVIDLQQPESKLWRNVDRIMRQNISTAIKEGVSIREAHGEQDAAYRLISETFKRSAMPFMSRESFTRFVDGLGRNGRILVAEHRGIAQSYALFAFSDYCAYAVYAGNLAGQHRGANKLLYWEAIRSFRQLGVQRYDFVGARINPARGSRQEGINLLKKRFGATLIQGYMWKFSLRPVASAVYSLAVRWLRGGDIVDHEGHKLVRTIPVGLGAEATFGAGSEIHDDVGSSV